MEKTKIAEQEFIEALNDLSEDVALKKKLIAEWNEGHSEALKKQLLVLRSSALSDVHEKQNELYQIDYILRKLN